MTCGTCDWQVLFIIFVTRIINNVLLRLNPWKPVGCQNNEWIWLWMFVFRRPVHCALLGAYTVLWLLPLWIYVNGFCFLWTCSCTDFTSPYPPQLCAKGIHVGFGSSLAHAKTVWQVEEWITVGSTILIEIWKRRGGVWRIYCKVNNCCCVYKAL